MVVALIALSGNVDVALIKTSVINEKDQTSAPTKDTNTISIMPVVEEGKNPSWLLFEEKPGKELSGRIIVKNLNTQKTLLADLYIVDVNADAGGFAPVGKEDVKKDAKWLSLLKNEVLLKPLEEAIIPFKGRIPLDATPGQHTMAIMAETVDPAALQATSGKKVSVSTRVGIRTYITVQGKIVTSAEVGHVEIFSKNPYIFKIDFKNTGNTLIKPSIDTEIYNWRNQKIAVMPTEQLYEIQPTGNVKLEVNWSETAMGKYTLKFKVAYPGGKEQMREASIIIYPPLHYIIAAIILLLLVMTNIIYLVKKKVSVMMPSAITPVYATIPNVVSISPSQPLIPPPVQSSPPPPVQPQI